MSMTHQVLARKWRPKTFSEVIGQQHVVQALQNALDRDHLHHAYLFTGSRGLGKTTIARILAKSLNCEQGVSSKPCGECAACQEIDNGRFVDLYEIDAASRTKVEDTRELLDNVQYSPTKGRFKVYLIDEVHMLSNHSFNALLKTLEEPPAHVKFLLATTDPQKLPATVLSRCLQFHLMLMTPEQISGHLATILQAEKVNFEQPALHLLSKAANGSMRDALSLLDQAIAYGNGTVNEAETKTMLGTIEPTTLYQILTALAAQNANDILAGVNQLAAQGIDFARALADLLSMLHQIAIAQAVADAPVNEFDAAQIHQLAQQIKPEETQLFYQIGLIGQRDMNLAPSPRAGFEMTLLRMLAFIPDTGESQSIKTTSKTTTVSNTTTANASATATTALTNIVWEDVLPQLSLSGAALALAQHCAVKNCQDNHLTLAIKTQQKPLLQDKYSKRINEALNNYYGQNIILKIEISDNELSTPAAIAEQKAASKQQAAEEHIKNDAQVQQLMQAFDAKVIAGSITAHEDNLH
jgi:DNA polymerase III subunit gamma/tau